MAEKFTLKHNSEELKIAPKLPVVPLRDVVVYPYMIFPLLIGRDFSINALQEAMTRDKLLLLVAQRQASTEIPSRRDLYDIGTIARILQVMKMPNGTLKVLVEGIVRANIDKLLLDETNYLTADIDVIAPIDHEKDREVEALSRSVSEGFVEYVRLNRRIPDEVLVTMASAEDHQQRADTVAAQILQKIETKQEILQCVDLKDELRLLSKVLKEEIEILKIEQKIDGTVRESMSRSQREFYLQQQLKAIKEELGQGDEPGAEVDDLYAKLDNYDYPDAVRDRAEDEIIKLSKMHPYSAEAAVVRSYIDWLLDLKWTTVTEDRTDFKEVRSILDGDHYGLEKAKKRILEHLAVIRLAGKVRGPILCLVGPPGVGKTSVGRSIARALGRKFVRMSLGGMHDEAEIRGHRRTYIGAMPGRIIQGIKKAGSANPVFLLDEVDKIGKDFRGDPAAALLEVLDPEQNATFTDNYLEVEFDLSNILFITTANSTASIPEPLLDRTEIIRLPGYLDFEKAAIANGYLLPKLINELGMADRSVSFDDPALYEIIRHYTRESGVRELERKLATVLRKKAVEIAEGRRLRKLKISKALVTKALGAKQFEGTDIKKSSTIGYAVGLAWTNKGGEVLPVEVVLMNGSGKLTMTGSLGDVMQESATAALSYIRNHADKYGLEVDFFEHKDIHVHVPEGAVPKDGPSAGITLMTAMLSAITDIPVRTDLAMTGEITLTGDVLPIGGLNEKLLAARRLGILDIIVPAKNRKDVGELPPDLTKGLNIRYVRTIRDVIKPALTESPYQSKRAKNDQRRGIPANR